MFFTLPNLLSILRLPLALLFFTQDVFWRSFAIFAAMITDGLDGFLARRYKQTSQSGRLIDPLMDRCFVFIALAFLVHEQSIGLWELLALLSRDISVSFFGIYLLVSGGLPRYRFGAIWCGKMTTFMQFILFFALVRGYKIPAPIYSLFLVIGIFALAELYLRREKETA